MGKPDLESLASFASGLANAAGQVQRRHYRTGFAVDDKADFSPVTIADREAEAVIRREIKARFPNHGIVGEEFEDDNVSSTWTWVIDPIDGTRSFVIGRPTFATLIALLFEGKPVLGVIDQSIIGDRWIGVDGIGTTLNGRAARTRACSSLGAATMLTTSPDLFRSDGEAAAYKAMKMTTKNIVYGGDALGYGLVAAGYADLVLEAGLKPFDFMALEPVLRNAGGCLTDWQGEALDIRSAGKVLALGDTARLNEAVDLLADAQA